MKNLALQRIQKMKPYTPPLAGRRAFRGMRLDFNERILPPSKTVQKALQNFLKSNTLQLYPEYGVLEKKISQFARVNENQVMITNGSDQAIDSIFRTFTEVGDTVIIPAPSFPMFSQSAQIMGNKILSPLYKKDDMSFPFNEILEMITDVVKLIVICNPNNPTGTLISIDVIEQIAKKAPNAIVLVDEAYFDYSKITATHLIKKYSNIVVIRTLSKVFGLASLRMGYVIASAMCISELLKVRGPYDVNMVAFIASLAAFDDLKSVRKYSDEIMRQSKPMVEEFFMRNGISFYQSGANFLLYRPVREREAEVLKENGILVRPQDKTNIEGTLRLTIGTVSQMKQFIRIYEKFVLRKDVLKTKYVFLDRDGTLIFEPQDTFQINTTSELKILPGVIKALQSLLKKDFKLVMVSNQDGLGTKSYPKENFDKVQEKLLRIFKKNGIIFADILICPHLAAQNCACRKPKTGLVEKFIKENVIDMNNSIVSGDRETDKQFAQNFGMRFVPAQTNSNFCTPLRNGGVL